MSLNKFSHTIYWHSQCNVCFNEDDAAVIVWYVHTNGVTAVITSMIYNSLIIRITHII